MRLAKTDKAHDRRMDLLRSLPATGPISIPQPPTKEGYVIAKDLKELMSIKLIERIGVGAYLPTYAGIAVRDNLARALS